MGADKWVESACVRFDPRPVKDFQRICMAFRIGRTLPPAAAPICFRDLVSGVAGLFRGSEAVTRFEGELKEYFGVGHCFTVSSGKAALTAILQSLKVMYPERDEVLIPAFTCYSVPSAITRAGLKIRLCDVAADTFDFDYEQLGHLISERSRRLLCILPVHLFGIPADVARIRTLVHDRDIVIVEDAAQAMGGESGGKKLGTLGDVGFFSLGRGKALSTVEGGIIITSRDDIADNLAGAVGVLGEYCALEKAGLLLYAVALVVLLRPSLFWLPKSLPFLRLGETIYAPDFPMRKMSAFQAGLAVGWERKLHGLKRVRSEKMHNFLGRLAARLPWLDAGRPPDLLRLPWRIESGRRRANILRASEASGLGLAAAYPDSVDRIPELRACFSPFHYPAARKNAERLLTLPLHEYLTGDDIDRIAELLRSEEWPIP